MGKIRRLTLALWLFSWTAVAKPIVFVTDVWPPYVLDANAGKGKGFFVDLVTEMCSNGPYTVEINYVPWLRAETMVKHGSAFAAFPYATTKTRRTFADFSLPLTQSANPPRVFFFEPLAPTEPPSNISELMTFRVGTYLGYYIKEKFDEQEAEYVLAQTEEQAFRLLQKGRMDYLPADPESGWKWINTLFPDAKDKFDVLPEPFPGTSLHLMVSREYPDSDTILAQCEQGFKAMFNSGRYHQLLKQKGKSDYAIPHSESPVD
ncbi:substrate-binding periplasmic protein [Vibrio ostreicida]|uniref:substrate-binding periplasmic protein n=1 Tax=Vibrio ostreicida TaxID=526588 RepID=UPI000970A5C8|nr:transporter substrate-binding domain-containing protein [Vibrio ostreicida]